ncbi:MAG: transposase [Planctomycetota bacterium]
MPQPGKVWRHGIIGTYGAWLPGDPRGWRSRKHKRHSSGDYKQPPPPGEHAGLFDFNQRHRPAAVTLPEPLRATVGERFREALEKQDHTVLALCVAGQHAHFLCELPLDPARTKHCIGLAKKASSRAIKREMPGRVWAAGGRYIIVDTPTYQQRVYHYIIRHRDEGAWVWTFRDDPDTD